MSDDIQRARMQHWASNPYQPVALEPELRVAHALEYIAAQMGQISAKLDRLIDAGK
jgi:hypothetical protein